MPKSQVVERGQQIMSFLMDNYPKAYDLQMLEAELKIPQSSIWRIISKRLLIAGQINEITDYKRVRYQWNKGAPVNVARPFELVPETATEINVWQICADGLIDWSKGRPDTPLGVNVILALLFGFELDEPSEKQMYNEFVHEMVRKLRVFMLAYRIAATIEKMPARERDLKRWSISTKLGNYEAHEKTKQMIINLMQWIPEPQ